MEMKPINFLKNRVYSYSYKQDLVLNNLPSLICHKTQSTDLFHTYMVSINYFFLMIVIFWTQLYGLSIS